MTYALMGRYCAEAVWIDQKMNLLHRLQSALTLSAAWELFKNLVVAWWKYELLEFALWTYRVHSSTREKWLLLWKQEIGQVKSS